jgi:hypothetical protein
MNTIDLGQGKLTNLVEIDEFLQDGNRITETEELFATRQSNNIIFVNNATSFSEINLWYLRLFSLFNIILMIITIIYSHKSKIINKNVYIIFLCLDILSILVNIFFTLFLLRKNFINEVEIMKNLYMDQGSIIGFYFLLNIILTSIMFYFIIDSLYGSWVDEGTHRRTLRWVISVFSISEFVISGIIDYEMEKTDKVPDNVMEHLTKNIEETN